MEGHDGIEAPVPKGQMQRVTSDKGDTLRMLSECSQCWQVHIQPQGSKTWCLEHQRYLSSPTTKIKQRAWLHRVFQGLVDELHLLL